MPDLPSAHFAQEDLEAYAEGGMAIELARQLEEHLNNCDECFLAVCVYREMKDLEQLGLLPEPVGFSLPEGSRAPSKRGIVASTLGALGGLLAVNVRGGWGNEGQLNPALAHDHHDHHPHTENGQDDVRDGHGHASSSFEGQHPGSNQGAHEGESDSMRHDERFRQAPTAFGIPAVDGASKYVQQNYRDTCAIQCQRLILNQFGVGVTEDQLRHEAIDQGIYKPGSGTSLQDVGKLLENHGVAVHRDLNANVFNLATELAQGHKVIVGVDAGELWHQNSFFESLGDKLGWREANHALIVSGIDTTDPNHVKVIVTDPGTGDVAKEYPLADFLTAWKTSHFAMISTAEPTPAWNPEMVNFDYHAGHLSHIGEAPYELAHELAEAAAHEQEPGLFRQLEDLFASAVTGGAAGDHAITDFLHSHAHDNSPLVNAIETLFGHASVGHGHGEDAHHDHVHPDPDPYHHHHPDPVPDGLHPQSSPDDDQPGHDTDPHSGFHQ